MKTIAELEVASNTATEARDDARRRIARVDRILAAMTLIDDSLGDGPLLGRAIIEAINKADNAQAFADLTAIRKAIRDNMSALDDAIDAAARALNAAPEEAA